MKWTPQKTMNSASAWSGGDAGQAEGVAPGVGPAHHLVPLVVVPEDEQPGAERGLGRADHRGQLVSWSRTCSARGAASVAGASGRPPCGERSDHGRRGQPGRPSAGYVGLGARYVSPETRPASAQSMPSTGADAVDWPAARQSGGDAYTAPPGSIPDAPGSYQFYDAEGRVLYVGKAKSLRHRLPNYWQDSAKLMPRTAQMVAQADHVEWIVVDSEVEALILEHSLIKAHLPRYNVRLKDDKSYPWLAVTLNDEWPRPAVVRGRKRKGVRYFGPYGNAGAIRATLDLLLRTFPVRTCSDTKFTRHERCGGPACSTTSSGARARASARWTTRRYDG